MYEQVLIPLSAPEKWKDALYHMKYAFAHTWESCYAMHLSTGYNTFLYVYESNDTKVVCPIAERRYDHYIDIVTPYGFSGFIATKSVKHFQDQWKKFAYDKGYICGYIGLNPILEEKTLLNMDEVHSYNTLFVFDLQKELDLLFKDLSNNRKRQLKAFDFENKAFIIDKSILKAFFLKNYHHFFAEKQASSIYNFSLETLSYIIDLDNVLLVGYVEAGDVKAVSVFAYTSYIAEYLFNISIEGGKHIAVQLIWYALYYFKSLKVPFLNLGGGLKPNDSIAEFKKRFGVLEFDLKAMKQVYNQEVYFKLCKHNGVDPYDKNSYFPQYRSTQIS